MPATVAAGASKQRSYSLPPETGTTTTAAIPAWTASTAYVIDATSSGTNTVTNGGNIYQCTTSGTSASSGGPTGTGTNITDGTAHWTFVSVVPSQNTTSGQQVVGVVARGTQSTIPGGSGNIPNTDNDSGGTYTTISNTNYNGFADSFLGIFYRATAANTKTAFTASAQFGGTSVGSGAGDEQTVMWLALSNVTTGAPHAHVQVERANGTGGIVTGASYTLSVPCIVVSVWGGNGNVLSAGSAHTAIPLDGMTLVPGCIRLISLSTSGYIQVAVGIRVLSPGTYTDRWQTGSGTSEGAQILSVAWPDVSTISADDDPPSPPTIGDILSRISVVTRPVPSDELAPAPTVVDDSCPLYQPSMIGWTAPPQVIAHDEIAQLRLDDDLPCVAVAPVLALVTPAAASARDELAVATFDDDVAQPLAASLVAFVASTALVAQDEAAQQATTVDDDATIAIPQLVQVQQQSAAVYDDVIAAVFALDDDTAPAPVALVQLTAQTQPAAQDELTAAPAVVDDDAQRLPASVMVALLSPPAVPPASEEAPGSSIGVDDVPAAFATPWLIQLTPMAGGMFEDQVAFAGSIAVDDSSPQWLVVVLPTWAPATVAVPEEWIASQVASPPIYFGPGAPSDGYLGPLAPTDVYFGPSS